ncbi:MAG: tetraacyldisaccharide 4'-kinase [Bacteroidales bacterium]|jgi:tetraacyldisaccharide 4'-kinase|nr:tetraacyldisaccharide 4'-kinase [Bacteroidales bacterium]
MIRPLKLLLWFAAQLYGLAVAVRNLLYDLGLLRSYSFGIPVICVGNITAGGTGKTPHVIWLAEKLSAHARVAVLSRGYLRKSRGFMPVTPESTPADAGDEPLLMARSLPMASVYVDRDRVNGIREILRRDPVTETVILDDGFQHRAVKAGMNTVLTDWNRLMTRDILLPLGLLREQIGAVKRADIIIVTKTPADVSRKERAQVIEELRAAGATAPVYFTTLSYGSPGHLFSETIREISAATHILMVTGIASPALMAEYLKSIAGSVTQVTFPDHHSFTAEDIGKITSAFDTMGGTDKIIVTTSKDGVRLKEIANIAVHVRQALHYLPVSVQFIENEEEFLNKVYSYARKDYQDR